MIAWLRILHAVAVFAAVSGCDLACNSAPAPPASTAQRQDFAPDSSSETGTPIEKPVAAPVFATESRYDGLTLDEWRERIKNLDPADPAADKAVPGLMEIVADAKAPWHSRRQAAETLGRIGEPARRAIPLLMELFTESEDETTSLWAAKALALYGPAAKEAVPSLVGRLQDRSASAARREVTLDALSRIGTADAAVMPALIDVVQSPDEEDELRRLTAESLGYIGSGAAAAVPALLRAARDENESLRRSAVAAIGSIGPRADVAVPTLAELLVFDESPAVRDQAADALARIGDRATQLLIRLLADEETEVRWRAARSLGMVQPPALSAVAPLEETLEDDDANVRLYAMESLWAIRHEAEPLIPFVLAEFTNEDRQLRIRAFRLLVSMGDKAQPAVERLQELLQDERPYVRQAARKALEGLPSD